MATKTPHSKRVAPKKATPRKVRVRDNNLKRKSSKAAAEVFVEALSRMPNQKGSITRAAKIAYPKQNHNSAHVTGSRLLRDPTVQALMRQRRERAAEHADMTRQQMKGMLTEMVEVSPGDFVNHRGELDWDLCRRRGIDHLVSGVTVTERHSEYQTKKGKRVINRRITTSFKVPDKIKALDLIAEIDGIKKQAMKNPVDSARESYEIMRRRPEYRDLPDQDLAQLAQESHGLPASAIPDILAGSVKG